MLELDDDLVHGPAADRRRRAAGDALQSRGDGREPVGRDAIEAVRHRDEEAVGRDDDGLRHAGHAAHEVRDEPVEVARLGRQLDHGQSSVAASVTDRGLVRPSCFPRSCRLSSSATRSGRGRTSEASGRGPDTGLVGQVRPRRAGSPDARSRAAQPPFPFPGLGTRRRRPLPRHRCPRSEPGARGHRRRSRAATRRSRHPPARLPSSQRAWVRPSPHAPAPRAPVNGPGRGAAPCRRRSALAGAREHGGREGDDGGEPGARRVAELDVDAVPSCQVGDHVQTERA